MKEQHLVFVYGTLRQVQSNHKLLGDAHCYGTGSTREMYAMYVSGGYPYVISTEARYPIVGELYAVDDATLDTLDKMEGHPRYYTRREIVVDVEGMEYSAWMYFRDPHGTLLPTGDYQSISSHVQKNHLPS
jgi:gamma-glutamylaminecyclotransferase